MSTYNGEVCKSFYQYNDMPGNFEIDVGETFNSVYLDEWDGYGHDQSAKSLRHFDVYPLWKEDLSQEKWDELQELKGEEGGIATCRALYDLNEDTGGFCCQTFGLQSVEKNLDIYYADMTYDTYTQEQLPKESHTVVLTDGDSYEVYWGAETFKSARAIAASAITMAACAIVYTQ